VTLLFSEGCCSGGCLDIPDPQQSGGPCRVFDILANGVLVADQFSPHVAAQRRLGEALPNSHWGVALAKSFTVSVTDSIEIKLVDLGSGVDPAGNPSLAGISIWPLIPIALKSFLRGDANGDGAQDISDAVAILSFLFLGEGINDCKDAADVNDDGSNDISDAVALLNYLFSGAVQPPMPFDSCGTDPSIDGLGCTSFSQCP
jgi:hypothetical protein